MAFKTLLGYLEEESLEKFLIGFPTVSRQKAEAVIELAAEKFLSAIDMKIFLDENMDVRLKKIFPVSQKVFKVRDMCK